jgi:threonylcarbamoyladenosine tRNA methylthiotransferase MtaB
MMELSDRSVVSERRTVAFYTLGCKVNQSETDAMADQFSDAGFTCVPFAAPADVYVVNTCTVTHVGDSKSRQILRQATRTKPGALVVATGCYASIVRDQLPIEDILVVRNRDKDKLLPIVQQHLDAVPDSAGHNGKPIIQGLSPALDRPRTRAMIKVQDGCDSACAYCIIPRARGRSRSTAPPEIVGRLEKLVACGHAEVVITGVDLGSYGEDTPSYPDLAGLLNLLLATSSVPRIRVSSVEPGDFNLDWLEVWQNRRLCRHFHVPLQAGSDSVLARMRRKYDCGQYLSMIESIRSRVPGVAITTDIITGFPGETEEEFDDGLQFIDACNFDGMHVFPYSRRPGTAAAQLDDHVSEPVKKHRAAVLRGRAESARAAHVQRHLGSTQQVVWECERDGVWRGLTDNNVRVFTTNRGRETSSAETYALTGRYADGCWGEPADIRQSVLQLVAI